MLKKLAMLAIAGALVSTAATSVAQDEKNPVITYRQKVMQSNADNLSAIADILKFSLPYQENIQAHARMIERTASLIPSAFKKNVSEGLTDAKPEIWEDFDEFKEYAADLEDASAKLADVAPGGDMAAIGKQFKAVVDTCKQCHEEFRKPKEESYKNRM